MGFSLLTCFLPEISFTAFCAPKDIPQVRSLSIKEVHDTLWHHFYAKMAHSAP
jgi:hypothetical protein